jgi:hypothetical protein
MQFDLGFIHNRLIDEGYTYNRLAFRGTSLKFGLGYGRETDRYICSFSVEASSGKVKSKSGNLASQLAIVKPAFEYVRKVKEYSLAGKESKLFAGVQLSSINYLLRNQPVFDNIDVLSVHGIFISASNQIKINKSQQLKIIYLLPAFASVNRVIFSEDNFTYEDVHHPVKSLFNNNSISYFRIFNLIQLRIAYEKKISPHTSFAARYSFFYFNNDFKTPVRIYSNEVLLGLKFGF